MPRALRHPAALFALASFPILLAAIAIVHSQRFATHVDIASWGVTFDLTITIPALYYLFVIRGGRARPMSIAPVFVVCAVVAALIIPRDQQHFLHQLRLLGIPLEVITLYLLATGVRPSGPVAELVAAEVAILKHAIFSWRAKPEVPAGATAVTIHERSGWGSIVVCIVVLIVFETIGAHLLVSIWSGIAAWIVTALDIYGILWLIGDYHALRLRPTLITDDAIELRYGLRWSATIARDNILSIDPIRNEADWKRRTTLKMAMLDEPRTLIRLREPVVAKGLMGLRKTIDAVAITPDDEASFAAALPR